jgi:hypothetical protein
VKNLLFLLALFLPVFSNAQTSFPENAWGSPDQWYCNDGFIKSNNQCIEIFIPPNAWAYADNWYCNNGYIKSEEQF